MRWIWKWSPVDRDEHIRLKYGWLPTDVIFLVTPSSTASHLSAAALTAHLPGQHNQASHGRGGDRPESFDEFGPVMEEWEATGGGVIAVHDPDGASYGVVSMSFPDDDDALSPWGAFTPDEARELADMIEGADAEMRVYRGEPTGPGGLVLGNTVVLPGGSGVIVGNTKEEVAIGWPRSPAARLEDVGGYDMRYISDDEVEDLTDFLRQASDLADDLIDEWAEEG